jgi:transcriptional regulator with XRE-family HTH domain
MADLKDVVAVNVRRLRNAKGWTQEDLADRVGLSARYVGQIERGQASMSVTVLGRLANAMSVDAAALVGGVRESHKRS